MLFLIPQGELQPIHMAASLGHTDILQYLASLPDVDPAIKCQTVCCQLVIRHMAPCKT